jgi:hypothetical protein
MTRKLHGIAQPHPAHLRCATLPLQGRVKMRDLILTTRSASEFYPWRAANWERPLSQSLLATCFCLPSSKEGRQNADRRRTNRRAYGRGARSAERARLSAFHRGSCIGERTPPLSSSRASWDAALTGVTRLPPIPVQRAPRRPVIVPAGRCPEPPGSGLQIRPRAPHPLHLTACLRKASLGERDFFLQNDAATVVKCGR